MIFLLILSQGVPKRCAMHEPQAENIPIEPDTGNAVEGSMLNILQRNPYPLIV